MSASLTQMNRIKELLSAKHPTQIWVCEQLGKSYNMVNSYVQNRRQPSIQQLFEIARLLDVQPRDLLIEVNSSTEQMAKKENKRAK